MLCTEGKRADMKNFKLYTYIITVDDGRSPCYTDGIFSLACCKPQIRRKILRDKLQAEKSGCEPIPSWIMGVRRDKQENKAKVIFIARIDEILRLEQYYDTSEYKARRDCTYHNVGTVFVNDKLPVTLEKEIIKAQYPKINAKNNEHGDFKNADDMTEQQCRDICGASVLLSKHFDHCNAYKDDWELTQRLTPALGSLLDDYMSGNRRHYHSFENDGDKPFEQVIKNINLATHENLKGFDEKSDKDIVCGKKKKITCGKC